MVRNQFTFYKSFYDAIQPLSKKDQASIILAICAYGLYEEIPTGLSASASMAFSLIKPTIDSGRRKAVNRMQSDNKTITKRNQNDNKAETNEKQNDNKTITKKEQIDKEKEREKERENEREENTLTSIFYREREKEGEQGEHPNVTTSAAPDSSLPSNIELYDKEAVKLTDDEVADLVKNMGEYYFKHYADVVAKCERSGRKYRKKHYIAISDMARKDGKWGQAQGKSFETDDFFAVAAARADALLSEYAPEDY